MDEKLEQRFETIFTTEELSRISSSSNSGLLSLNIDLHQMHKAEAERFLKNTIALTRGECVVTVIHGYNGGQVLQNMARTEKINNRIDDIKCPAWNPGITKYHVQAAA